MRKVTLLIAVTFYLAACNITPQTPKNTVTEYKQTVIETVGENIGYAESTLSIDGMSCEIMCGNMIKDELKKFDGVELVSIDFNAERNENYCTVKYQQSSQTPEKFVEAVEALNKGAYEVSTVKTSVWVEKTENPTEENKGETASISPSDLIPGIFSVFSYVFK